MNHRIKKCYYSLELFKDPYSLGIPQEPLRAQCRVKGYWKNL